ncbi:hypothetical protein PIB30_062116 [Stylosanthes scabra]|uniref:Ubiquitin-like protease family profile domain-containing protein n=1 Tax=Stylosanthes scabra TaxID=79078 RepID=A0ABU6VKS3_9FABA|nr:hypothetical protein [Stylosanthes scabra]
MRARKKKEERKRQEGKDKKQTEESDSLGSESNEDSEEEEYQITDSEPEPEPEPEMQRERRSKKKEDDIVIDTNPVQPQMDIPVQAAIIPEPEAEPEPPKKKTKTSAKEIDTNLVQSKMDIPVQAKIMPEHEAETEPPNKKTKTTTKEVDTNPVQPRVDIPVQAATIPEPEAELEPTIHIGPQPQPEPIIYIGPQPQPESNIEGGPEPMIDIGPEPAELLDGYMAECEWAEKIYERKKGEVDAEIKAYDEAEAQYKSKRTTGEGIGESEIDLAIRRAVEGVVAEAQEMEKQERQAAPTLNKIFEFNGEWHLEVPRSQFRTMRSGKEVDSAVITAYSLVLNDEPIPRFQNDVYILPPRALSKVMDHYKENYIDIGTKNVHSIDPFESDEHLSMVNNYKLITHRYIFAPVLYSDHWWMYVLDKVKKNFFVIDSRPKEDPGPERTKINKFAIRQLDKSAIGQGRISFAPHEGDKE